MPTYNTTMSAIIGGLDDKIAAMQSAKASVQAAIDRNISVPRNTGVLQQIDHSLEIVQQARSALFSDCCGASCTFTWEEEMTRGI